MYVEALAKFNTNLNEYVSDLENKLDQAYNEDCRRCGWYPIPLEQSLLNTRFSRALQNNPSSLKSGMERQAAVQKLRELASTCDATFTISVRPNGVSVICNFLLPSGELIIQYT